MHIHENRPHYHFRFYNVGRWIIWSLFALLLAVAPLVWTSGFAQTMLSQMGIAIIVCLAYNMLLGQGGMLSFGAAVYSGLGSFMAIHTLNLVSAGALAVPVSLIPLGGTRDQWPGEVSSLNLRVRKRLVERKTRM